MNINVDTRYTLRELQLRVHCIFNIHNRGPSLTIE